MVMDAGMLSAFVDEESAAVMPFVGATVDRVKVQVPDEPAVTFIGTQTRDCRVIGAGVSES